MGTDLLSDISREIDARLRELRPLVDEHEELLRALGALSPDVDARTTIRGKPSVSGKAHEAILGALEHGSHTVAELAIVTAMSAAAINRGVRALLGAGVVRKTEREGKPAWALAASIDQPAPSA